ncbi:MAG: sensor histidine kinase [Tetrasphaera sp.]|nr:sensor histidine kinase [Tetrasphaera sp.]
MAGPHRGARLPPRPHDEVCRGTSPRHPRLSGQRHSRGRGPGLHQGPPQGRARPYRGGRRANRGRGRPSSGSAPRSSPTRPRRAQSQPTKAVTAYLPRGDLLRAVTNLVDNAVRHARTEVRLTAYPVRVDPAEQPLVEIAVSDDGHGIPEQDRERVFDRFARLDDARARDEGGSGLGLAIARELIRRNRATSDLRMPPRRARSGDGAIGPSRLARAVGLLSE